MFTKRWSYSISLFAAFIMALTGCSDNKNTEDKGAKKYLVIFCQANSGEPYRAAGNKLMQELFSQYDDVELVIKDGQGDNSKQRAQIQNSIQQEPDLLIVAPKETQPPTEIMGQAINAGIKTICLERSIAKPNYTTFVSCDNYKIGKMAGEFIVEKLKEKHGKPAGKIAEIRGDLGLEAETDRYNGAHDVWENYPEIEIVHTAVGDWSQSSGRKRMQEILSAQAEIDVVYGHNDPMAIGAYLAAKDVGRENKMLFVGIDGLGGPSGGIKKVMDGILAATFIYPLCVDKAVEVGNKLLRDPDFVPEKIYTIESAIVTPENAASMYKETVN